MIQIRTTIGGEQRLLDTYGDEDVKISISFAEVQDITKKNSSYTQSFKLPGSKNNNDIFNHFYNFQSSTFDFDARRKFDCQLLLDGVELYDGYLRLNGSTRDKNEIIYDVVFYSEVGNLVANIGDQLLSDIDFDNLSHPYRASTILYSYAIDSNSYILGADGNTGISGTAPYANGKISYALLSKGYQYTGQTFDDTNIDYTDTSIIDFNYDTDGSGTFGNMTNFSTPIQWYYMTPTIQIKEVYDRIFTGAGYNIQSEFMDTDYFKNYYLPLTFDDEDIFVGQAIDPKYAFDSDLIVPTPVIVDYVPYTWTKMIFPPFPTEFSQRILHEVVYEDNFNATLSDYAFKLNTPGLYRGRITFSGFNSELYPETVNLDAAVRFHLRSSQFSTFDTGTTLTFTSGYTRHTTPFIYVPPGQSVTDIAYTFYWTNTSSAEIAYALDGDFFDGVGTFEPTKIKFEILEGPRQIPSGDFNPSDEFPCCQYKQLDFIASINQFFNMVTVPIPGLPNTLRVEPVIDFIGKGETLDWSSKVDRDSPIKVEPLTDIIEGTLNYMYTEDDGWGNETFTKANNYVFGNLNVELNQDYKDKSTDFETDFGAEVDRVLAGGPSLNNVNYATSPIYFQVKEREGEDGTVIPEFNPYRTTPKLLFKGFNMPTCTMGTVTQDLNGFVTEISPYWYLTDQLMSYWKTQNRFTTYPFGIENYSHYTNWGDDRFDKSELSFPGADTLYDVYWKDYIEDLTNADNRLVTMSMYFDPFELSQLKQDEKILIDNTLFRINSISNYSLVNQGLADVELIKLTKEYEPHKKIYYTATPCPGNECDTIYSNSDLQTNLWAFANKYFQFQSSNTYGGNDCGCFYLTYSYDPPIGFVPDYQPILIKNGLTTSAGIGGPYALYDNCDECELNALSSLNQCLDVSNSIVPEPTPTATATGPIPPTPSCSLPSVSPLPVTPTSTSTPTPTPTPTTGPCTCIEYGVSNNNPTQFQGFTYSPCDGSLPIAYPPFPPETSVVVCACENSIKASRDMVITNLGPCLDPIDPTPTPTPSVTATNTPTPTHTPTPTPTFGGGTPLDDTICNTGTFPITVSYVDCATGNLIQVVIPPGECAEACACSPITFVGPVGEEGSMVVTNNGPCIYVCDRGRFNYGITSGGTVSGFIIQTRQTTYSGGTLTGAYYDGPTWLTATNADKNDYNNYVRNTPLNGGLYQVYQGGDTQGTGGFSQTFWSNTDNSWIVRQTQNDSGFNPIYFQGSLVTGGLVNYVSQNATGSTIYQGNFYPPNSGITFNNADNPPGALADYFEYDDPCIQPAPTPTPSAYNASYYDLTPCGGGSTVFAKAYYQGTLIVGNVVELSIGGTGCYEVNSVIPFPVSTTNVIDTSSIYSDCTNCTGGIPSSPTPTPTQTPTLTPTNTVTPTMTPTPSATPLVGFLCTLYTVSNFGLSTLDYKWRDCSTGQTNTAQLGVGQAIQICARTGSVVIASGGNGTITESGNCTP